jgi:hypothetical protein
MVPVGELFDYETELNAKTMQVVTDVMASDGYKNEIAWEQIHDDELSGLKQTLLDNGIVSIDDIDWDAWWNPPHTKPDMDNFIIGEDDRLNDRLDSVARQGLNQWLKGNRARQYAQIQPGQVPAPMSEAEARAQYDETKIAKKKTQDAYMTTMMAIQRTENENGYVIEGMEEENAKLKEEHKEAKIPYDKAWKEHWDARKELKAAKEREPDSDAGGLGSDAGPSRPEAQDERTGPRKRCPRGSRKDPKTGQCKPHGGRR